MELKPKPLFFLKGLLLITLLVTSLCSTAQSAYVKKYRPLADSLSEEFGIPVKYIGVGEKAEDLQVFSKTEFVDSLFKK